MRKLGVILSHKLSEMQELDAKSTMSITDIVYLPNKLQQIWSNADPHKQSLADDVDIIMQWVDDNFTEHDYIVVQGDYGATFLLVSACLVRGIIPVYSTTMRCAKEVVNPDGSISIERVFKHVKFRRYQ